MKNIILSVLLSFFIFTSCQKELTCPDCKSNQPPIAKAGIDQTITLPIDSVVLDGSFSSDTDGTITAWNWKKITGLASLNILFPDKAKTTVKNLIAGIYTFELTVKDNGGLAAKDTIVINVINASFPNRPPVANAGPDQTITLPNNIAILDGTKSTDPDNNISNYDWTIISGPNSFNINNKNAVQTQVTNLDAGIYQFELKVTDAGGLIDKDTILIIVTQAPPHTGNNNVLFFFRDITGGLETANITVLESFSPRTVLVKVKITNFPDAEIEGVWSRIYTPTCPFSSIVADETSYGTFNLPPGTYNWIAESVTTDLTRFGVLVPLSFQQYWGAGPRSAQGIITVQTGADCIIKEIVF